MEDKEAHNKTQERQTAHSKARVSPAIVACAPAQVSKLGLPFSCGLLPAGLGGRAAVVGNETPSDERRDQLANWPEDREQCQEVLPPARNKLEEEHTIDGKSTAETETKRGDKPAKTRKAVRTSAGQPKHAGDKQGHVERNAPTQDICKHTPDRSSHSQTKEQGQGHERRMRLLDVEFYTDLLEKHSNLLQPEVVDKPAEAGHKQETILPVGHANMLVHDLVKNVHLPRINRANSHRFLVHRRDLIGFLDHDILLTSLLVLVQDLLHIWDGV